MDTTDRTDNVNRRSVLTALGALGAPLALALPGTAVAQDDGRKILRVAFRSPETTFDPARISDLYSRTVTANVFEALYGYDYLARPIKVVPVLADGMPEVSADFKVWTVKLRKGIYFADDPAFRGKRRELVAEDVLLPFKRHVDPANKSPGATSVLEEGIVGLAAVREAALKQRKPFDYSTPVPGLQALDRYTVRFTLEGPRPRFLTAMLSAPDLYGAFAHEILDFYGTEAAGDHPVGTGPFRLKQWVRSSKIVLERNPTYRERVYEAQPAADDAEGQAILARLKGRRIPMVDEVQVSIIEEGQPRWLSFVNAEIDGLMSTASPVPEEFATLAVPNGKLAPNLAKRNIQHQRVVLSDVTILYFNMEDPVVGGYTPEKVALRRAFSLSYDIEREIRLIRRGQAVPAQSPFAPNTSGYDPKFKSEMSDYDPARARALLDMYGYLDRDGDGWRELPDGSPLVLKIATQPDQTYRAYNDLQRRCLRAIGIRCEFDIQQWPANLKRGQAGTLQIWSFGLSSADPDGQTGLQYYYGPQAGDQNIARFKLPAMDQLYEKLKAMPDGPEREALFLETKRIAVAYMPYRYQVHRIANELLHPWVHGYRRGVFWENWWHMVDVEPRVNPA